MSNPLPIERVERAILLMRGQKVILDSDLADLYGVTTKRLNEQVKRNRKRFPKDFMVRLTPKEKAEVVANCDYLSEVKTGIGIAVLVFCDRIGIDSHTVYASRVLTNSRARTRSSLVQSCCSSSRCSSAATRAVTSGSIMSI